VRLHLVDGTFELFRAHYSRRPDRPLKATVGVAESLLTLLADRGEAVTHVAVAFDNPIRSFRNDLFAGYKTEEGVEPALLAQFDSVEEAVRAAGVTVWSMKQWEADDALASAAARWRAEVEQVRILTPDKDLGQSLRGRQVVQVDRLRNVEIDEAALVARRGIGPQSIPDFLALVGDTADGIPGLDGFGEKSAGKLLARFVKLESIPDDARAWPEGIRGAPALAQTLASHRTEALLYRRLATLAEDVPLKETLEDLRWRGVAKEFDSWCARVEAPGLRERIPPVR
jgi:5'-3' exonuclease